MAVRLNLRAALLALCALVMLLTLYWSRCGDFGVKPGSALHAGAAGGAGGGERARDIECSINGEYSVACRRDTVDGEVYIPFSFIKKYFEIYGKITSTEGVERFEWSHSYSKVYHPKRKYDPRGTFVTFENYNVEVRERVKCISAVDGVPVSTQWDPRGFYYPTQIAQFGLAHYSKNITEPPPRVRVLEDGDKHRANWIVSEDAVLSREYDADLKSDVVRFATGAAGDSRVGLRLSLERDFVLGLDLMLRHNSSMTVELQHKENKETYYLHYVTSSQLIYAQDEHTYYGVGTEARWRRLTRDLIVDMQKGWALLDRPKRKAPRNKFVVVGVWLRGAGGAGRVSVSSSAHGAHVVAAARWLVAAQRARGGWPVPARRRLAPMVPDLAPGWHSAMSQGHGISLLSRAWHRSGEAQYLRAARAALQLLAVPVADGGVQAVWMGTHYIWFEEYPTTPPLFVLNGFIYTLLGLFDLHAAETAAGGEGGEGGAGGGAPSEAKRLYDAGMTSLKTLLPLFDTGSGSFYDLRHFTLGVSPNVARWDYHATHVNQLYLLATLDNDPVLLNTAKRWEGYMQGKRAAHN